MSQTPRVPLSQKLAFGFGMLANQMFPAALGVFFVVLIDGLGFSTLAWGFIMFAPRLFDAITDPIMGFVSDNTRSRWGRRRPYVLIGGLILGISYIAMWQLYKENGLTYNFWYFMALSLVFYLGLTIFSVPYVAMGYEMSDDFHERTRIMAIAQFIGQWAWVIVPWFWVILYDPSWFPDADSVKAVADGVEGAELKAAPDVGVRHLAVWVAIPCALFAIVPALFIRSKSTVDREDFKPINLGSVMGSLGDIAKSAIAALKIRQFRMLALATFLIFNSFNMIAQFTFFIIKFHLFDGNEGAMGKWPALHGSVGALITTFLVIPIVTTMANKIGKKRAFFVSQSISIIGYVLFWFLFVPGKPSLFLWALPFHSFGIGGLFTLMMSMTADVCDLDELQTGQRREGMLGAVYWWMVKFGGAFAGLLGGVIMWFVDFDPGKVTASSLTGLRVAYSLVPIIGVIGAIAIMWAYDITEERAEDIRKQLANKKGSDEIADSQ